MADAFKTKEYQLAIEDAVQMRENLRINNLIEDGQILIEESLEGTGQVQNIVQGLKGFSRKEDEICEAADINDCMESSINLVWNEIKYKATVIRDFGDIPTVDCFPQQINQVFVNLLVNAVQAIEKQGVISIKTWSKGKNVYITVSDTGCGIPAKDLNRIFEPFFTTKEVGKGTGLGMSISYDIVKNHGGKLSVVSDVDQGTTFTLVLPLVMPTDE